MDFKTDLTIITICFDFLRFCCKYSGFMRKNLMICKVESSRFVVFCFCFLQVALCIYFRFIQNQTITAMILTLILVFAVVLVPNHLIYFLSPRRLHIRRTVI